MDSLTLRILLSPDFSFSEMSKFGFMSHLRFLALLITTRLLHRNDSHYTYIPIRVLRAGLEWSSRGRKLRKFGVCSGEGFLLFNACLCLVMDC